MPRLKLPKLDLSPQAQSIIFTLVCVIIAMGMFIWAYNIKDDVLRGIITTLGSLFLISAPIAAWGTYVARSEVRTFFEQNLKLNEKLQECGVVDTPAWPIPFPTYAKKLTIFKMRGHSWFGTHSRKLKTLLEHGGKTTVKIYLLDPNATCCPALAEYFNETADQCKDKIRHSIIELIVASEQSTPRHKSDFELYVFSIVPRHAYYIIDDDFYFSWSGLARGRIAELPMLKLKGGTLKKFFEEDIDRFLGGNDIRLVYSKTQGLEAARAELVRCGIDMNDLETKVQAR